MFRLPHSNRTFFQCDVAICKGECKKHDCKKEKLTLEDEGNLKRNKLIMEWTLLKQMIENIKMIHILYFLKENLLKAVIVQRMNYLKHQKMMQ